MAGPGVFHVQFGINDTHLTQTLERRDYVSAERIIRENINPSYLDEGCYQRIPLYIVLCGLDQEEQQVVPRHFYIAKLLVESGADVNYRVPTTYFGSEYMGPGKTALELLLDFYNIITRHESHIRADSEMPSGWTAAYYPVIGLNKEELLTYEDVVEQLLELFFIMISNGADVNIVDEYRMTPLHRTVIYSKDLLLSELLLESGANVCAQDFKGNTPLGAVCDAFPWGIQGFLDEHPLGNPYSECCHLQGKEGFIACLLSHSNNKIDHQNKTGRTALFNSMVQADFHTIFKLLSHGADTTLRGQVLLGKNKTREVSPLFAALASFQIVPTHAARHTAYQSGTYHILSQLLDSGHFTKSKVTSELHEYIDSDFPEFSHLKVFGTQLLHLLFGGATTTLRQLSTRAIFQTFNSFRQQHQISDSLHTQQNKAPPVMIISSDEMLPYSFSPGVGLSDDIRIGERSEDTRMGMSVTLLESLVEKVGLPKDALVYFEVELLRQRLCVTFKQHQWFKYYDEELDTSESEEFPTDEDDSDLEYW